MQLRVFGRTGMQLSVLGFGCGAVGGLMVRGDPADQERTIARAIAAGVNYFDTAVQYGNGESEKNLGRVLQKLKPADVVVGTKVRLPPGEFGRIADAVTTSLEGSLARLGLDRVDIFHLHNPITETGGGNGAERPAGAGRRGTGVRAPAPARQDSFPRDYGARRHGRTASGDRCKRLRQRSGRLQHAQSICRRRIAGELSGTGLWTIVRSHQGGRRRRRGNPRACRRRTCRARPNVTRLRVRRPADWFGDELRCRCRSRSPPVSAGGGGARRPA